MRIAFYTLAFVLCLTPASADTPLADIDSARAFFEKYITLGDAYDPGLAELYADSAIIRSSRRYPDGQQRVLELSGTKWKALLIASLPLAKARDDKSTYMNVQITTTAATARISATRYSELKCYTDTGYYMVIERRPDAEYRIVEEYSETQPQSNC